MGIRERIRSASAGCASLGFVAFLIIGCTALNAVDDSGKAELNTKETQPSFKVQV